MKKDGIKKRFMDILFEPDESETDIELEPEEEPVKPVQPVKKVEKKVEKKEPSMSAKDLLYNKDSTFINYEKKSAQSKPQEEEPYEFSSQISPIFGVINDNKKKETPVSEKRVDSAITTKTSESGLDIVPSPIYGYASNADILKKEEVSQAVEETSEEEIHRIFEKEDPQEYHNPYETRTEELSLFDLYEEDKK